jgi:hypothetical protein
MAGAIKVIKPRPVVGLIIVSLGLGLLIGWIGRGAVSESPVLVVEFGIWMLIALTVAGGFSCAALLLWPGDQPGQWTAAKFGLAVMVLGVVALALIGVADL